MRSEQLVHEIQRHYPQIYLACHVDHVRTKSTKWQLSSKDSSILSQRGAAVHGLALLAKAARSMQ